LHTYKLTVAPNPATNQINIAFEVMDQDVVNLSIIDINGRAVQSLLNKSFLEKGIYSQTFNIAVQKGVYFVVIKGLESRQTQKLIIH
jgi:Secretion system C-terminal sorting domain